MVITTPGLEAGPARVPHTRPVIVAPLRAVKRTSSTIPAPLSSHS